MPLNWREIELILSELHLEGALIQKVVQNSFHALTWMLYTKSEGGFALYTEVGTSDSRICLTDVSMAKSKTAKLQRFVQFARANIEGARIVAVKQKPGDREIRLTLLRSQQTMYIFIRLFSGPGANIIVTDSGFRILDLLLRRPNRNEMSGQTLVTEQPGETSAETITGAVTPGAGTEEAATKAEIPAEATEEDIMNGTRAAGQAGLKERTPHSRPMQKEFTIRPRIEGLSFNEQIDMEQTRTSLESQSAQLRASLENQRDRAIAREMATRASLERTMEKTRGYEELRITADLLAANINRIEPRQTSIEVEDYTTGGKRLITLDPSLRGSAHVASFYEKAKKAKGAFENAQKEWQATQTRIDRLQLYYQSILAPSEDLQADIKKLKAALAHSQPPQSKPQSQAGISCQSGAFQITIGRTAKENDQLLRHGFKGSDYWFHTRDCPGGYVFVRCPKGKTIPLQVMLDAANLAALYSKQRNNASVNLHYTQVKYLRRAKDGPVGLVLPSQEKNLTIKPDRKRAEAVLGSKEFSYEG